MKFKFVLSMFTLCACLLLLFVSCGECEHDFGEWEIIKEPTCVDEGTKIAVCSSCSFTKSEAIEMTEHAKITVEGTPSTCQETGLTDGIKCKDCDKIFTEQKLVPKIGHCFVSDKCNMCGTDYYTESLVFAINNDSSSYTVSLGNCQDEKIVIPNSYEGLPVTHIDNTSFNNGNFKEIVIPNSILTIEIGTFKGCSALEKITIPFVGKSADSTGKEALFGYIFGDTEYAGSYEASQSFPSPYVNATYVEDYYIPSTLCEVTLNGKITFGAFSRCKSLSVITVSASYKEIPNYSFRECTSLLSFSIPATVETIRGYAFTGCSSLANYIVDTENKVYKSVDGHILSKDGKTFVLYAGGKNASSFTLFDDVKEIGNYAFYMVENLEEIRFPSSLEKIGYYSFSECSSLKSLTVPSSVSYIDDYAFSSCNSLQSVFLPKELSFVGKGAFWKLSKGATIYYSAEVENANWDKQWNASNYTVILGEAIE